ncbi:stage V sporulation protein B [Paenibacillus albiflavus]|uniref:Stage V sporulation protein B n=1 Tax=Paenibacillus albiflavus TaxID=2545760 RepID=A0A4R4E614_9BACL|nr:stage V sporulation protein B [Paenibacillus albiflavus]TCZ75114.1 stage V sporulation protein B [Paenibacillus albiflavus]
MGKQSFITGMLILLGAGLLNRILGFVPRIMLPRLIGAEGVGLYQLGWPFLSVILTIVIGGIPLAVSKLVAQSEAENNELRTKAILKTSLTLSVTLAFIFTGICLIASSWITSHLLTDNRVYYTFISMSPIIIIVSVSSVLRGFFQGKQDMIPSATSQIVETIVRIIMVLICAYVLLPYGIEFAAAGAMLGVLAGEIAGVFVLVMHYRQTKKKQLPQERSKFGASFKISRTPILSSLLRITIPVTGSRLVGASSYLFESILIAQSLAAAGIATAIATAQYGALQGMVIPILLLPSALTGALSTSLIPSLSEAAARKDYETVRMRMNQSMRLALLAGAPFAVILFVLADPLCSLLYNHSEVGSMLAMMAPVALLIYIQGPLQAALQALDRPGVALINTLIGAVVKLVLIYLLVSRPEIGIRGAIIASNINIVLVTLLHLRSVKRWLHYSLHHIDFLKVLLAMFVSGTCCFMIMRIEWSEQLTVRFFASCAVAVFVYIGMIIGLRLIHPTDLNRILKLGRKIVKV